MAVRQTIIIGVVLVRLLTLRTHIQSRHSLPGNLQKIVNDFFRVRKLLALP